MVSLFRADIYFPSPESAVKGIRDILAVWNYLHSRILVYPEKTSETRGKSLEQIENELILQSGSR
jgi:hypothetical protein